MARWNNYKEKWEIDMKKIFFLIVLLKLAYVYAEDSRDRTYEYLGSWLIIETFQLDSLWIEDIFDSEEASIMEGEIIVYITSEIKTRKHQAACLVM